MKKIYCKITVVHAAEKINTVMLARELTNLRTKEDLSLHTL